MQTGLLHTTTIHDHRIHLFRSLFLLIVALSVGVLSWMSASLPDTHDDAVNMESQGFPLIAGASAKSAVNFTGSVVRQSHTTITVTTGKSMTLWAEFRNDGDVAWETTGKNFLALNVTSPTGRTSAFAHQFWPKPYRPAVGRGKAVAPKATIRIPFAITAPSEPGTYTERFQLVAEHHSWIEGTLVEFVITVRPPPPPYAAAIAQQSFSTVVLRPYETTEVWVDYTNRGTETWKSSGKNFLAFNVTDPSGRTSAFHDAIWQKSYRPTLLTSGSVKPGETTRVRFTLRAPATPGRHDERFQLVSENKAWIEGSAITVPIIVEADAVEQSAHEPSIAVGLTPTNDATRITANGVFALKQGVALIATEQVQEVVTLSYANGTYTATDMTGTYTGTTPFEAVPLDATTILEALSFENRPLWNPGLNDNRFRGSLTIRAADTGGAVWLINTLPLEAYLRGIAESTNDAPAEYQKALIVAARTYASYHAQRMTKHANEHFTVDATNDQVYRGYGFEIRAPRVTEAVTETRALIVSYNGSLAITPYFSQSDGRTRSWEEVWSGGPYPWLVSKDDPACISLPLLGHGVGMSAKGAYTMAGEGKSMADILAYYFTGTALTPAYE